MYWFVTAGEAELQLRTAFPGLAQLNCDSKRKHDMLLTLWGFLEMRNAEQETLHTCTNSCTTVFQFTASCQHPCANNLAVPFLWASKEKVQLKLLILLVEYKIQLCANKHARWFYISPIYKRTYKSLYKYRCKKAKWCRSKVLKLFVSVEGAVICFTNL